MLHEVEKQQDVGVVVVFFSDQLLLPVLPLWDVEAAVKNVHSSKFSKCVRSDFCLGDRWCC